MNKQLTHSSLNSALRLAAAAALLAGLTGSAAHAQATVLTAPPTGGVTLTTDTFPAGDASQYIYGPFTSPIRAIQNDALAPIIDNVTFTATNTNPAAGSVSFEGYNNFDNSLAFPTGTQLADTFDSNNPTGPLRVDFSTPVTAFGFSAQDQSFDTETFTFIVSTTGVSGAQTKTFVTPAYDNTSIFTAGKTVFLGAQAASGNLITSVLVSSTSVAIRGGVTYTGGSNDFYFGPLSIYSAAVPEASTLISFGLLLALALGAGALTARKKMTSA